MTANSELADGVLCQSRDGKFGEAVFFCRLGRRHYVPSAAHIAALGRKWPDDVMQVDSAVLDAFTVGSQVPEVTAARAWSEADIERSSVRMREHMASVLKGSGVEIGAGASPFPVPLRCRVLYGDKVSYETLMRRRYAGQTESQLVLPDLQIEFDSLAGIADETLDFVIGCHVIEHTKNPIGVFASAWKKLKPGGYLLLVVPDKERTFDRARPVTSLEHMISDFERPDRLRDFQHYDEFYRLAFATPESEVSAIVDREFARDGDIHYHVWTYASFMEMAAYIDSHVAKWSEIVSHPALSHPELDIEFYVRLRK